VGGSGFVRTGPLFFNDANCYRRLARELGRWVASVTSPNNPNCHVPTDEEIQHQARWILYDNDDPWNQTAADNAEWLRRFKRGVGLVADGGPGLPETDAWAVKLGGSGFAPPYAFPGAGAQLQLQPPSSCAGAMATVAAAAAAGGDIDHSCKNIDKVPITLRPGTRPFELDAATANMYLASLTTRYPPPPKVFCPRELEEGLAAFVADEVVTGARPFPSDDALRARGRAILGTNATAADDPVLLESFKTMVRDRLMLPPQEQQQRQQEQQGVPVSTQPTAVGGGGETTADGEAGLAFTDAELEQFVQDMSLDFGDAADMAAAAGLGLDIPYPEN